MQRIGHGSHSRLRCTKSHHIRQTHQQLICCSRLANVEGVSLATGDVGNSDWASGNCSVLAVLVLGAKIECSNEAREHSRIQAVDTKPV